MGYNIEIDYIDSPNQNFKCEDFKIHEKSIVFLNTNLMSIDKNVEVHVIPFKHFKNCNISEFDNE